MSLNPLVHVDLVRHDRVSAGRDVLESADHRWAKPVPVNVRNLGGDWRRKYMLIAAAGPASNLVIAVVGGAVSSPDAVGGFDGEAIASGSAGCRSSLIRVVTLNVLLAVFNMLPVPPLDGGNVLAGLLRAGGRGVRQASPVRFPDPVRSAPDGRLCDAGQSGRTTVVMDGCSDRNLKRTENRAEA